MQSDQDTICAQTTPPGRGGVGIIRLSGPKALDYGKQLSHNKGQLRHAHYGPFLDHQGEQIDAGISLFFKGPDSFTGEDVFEFQGHGGQVVMDLLQRELTLLGARIARPGEFSERAFLNDKLDLAQAESIADLIDASSEQAARNALRSLQGVFSTHINALVESLIYLRLYVEAAIDFPEEEIDFLADGKVTSLLEHVRQDLDQLLAQAQQGSLLQEGMQVVIAGAPNAGKSSLLNALAGQDRAIVTDIAGTTRDLLKEAIHIDGLPLHIVDTAGLRESPDTVEKIGIERALKAIADADQVLLLQDAQDPASPAEHWFKLMGEGHMPQQVTLVRNKIDLANTPPQLTQVESVDCIYVSAKHRLGLDLLRQQLKQAVGYQATLEGGFSARRRHLDALKRCQKLLNDGATQLAYSQAGELLAEDLRLAQECLNEITGTFTSDDLLGRIFGSFCIGK
ncbi:MAG: tRNA uridine-5-carboxymethylaminomethyl(34) synthesis GTPase MnmE [Oceanospirillaceae bacterium]|jgi:tRNA modification GTPase|nr:tRNA uridine-5-carboxymethylaminomethyl(34) synthesis GTPase MnmE [Oceanospirillaceae bacterium]MBT4444250.1 tRNA uridine-5-carboxymethylaminomethyl(34) synthesis GTPase MnmE [Oceanospirillaceae bacterium]MBT6078449.1 tRNA uridine-5-carboxymethylaminomethyl(34) synthesis GTPase MnmE [Oceanospirillaceae bacterium]